MSANRSRNETISRLAKRRNFITTSHPGVFCGGGVAEEAEAKWAREVS